LQHFSKKFVERRLAIYQTMKIHSSHKYRYFIFSIVFLASATSLFFWIDARRQHHSSPVAPASVVSKSPSAYYSKEKQPLYVQNLDSNLHLQNVRSDSQRHNLVILNDWKVRGWRLTCPIEPMLNEWETGKVVFKVKINEDGRMVAVEPLPQLSTLSEENIQSFKTSIELELENCLERKEVKLESISSGTLSFFVSKP